eukprot:jgi/Chrzof1/10108/Cz04g29020.t1
MAFAHQQRVPDGHFTQVIYGYINDNKLAEAIDVLQQEQQNFPDSRAASSLLGYCYYCSGQFEPALSMYEQLVRLYPDNEEYKLYYAQTLYKAGMYPESTKAALRVHSQALSKQVNTLLVANAYEQDDLPGEKANTTINNNRTLGVHSSIDIQALLSAHAP